MQKIETISNKNKGQAIVTAILFFLIVTATIVFGLTAPVGRQIKATSDLEKSRKSLFLVESLNEDIIYRLKSGFSVPSSNSLTFDGNTATATVSSVSAGKQVLVAGSVSDLYRSVKTILANGTGVAFNYGVQSGNGGMVLENSSTIEGNAYSNGSIDGVNSMSLIKGDVISAGPNGYIKDIEATSSAYAHTIEDSLIRKDAYYVNKIDTTVQGNSYPGSPDQATTSLPIGDDLIESWKDEASSGGTITTPCPYIIQTTTTIGPKKINCDTIIRGGVTVTLEGPLWIDGDLTIEANSTKLKVASSFGSRSIPIVVDDEDDSGGGGRITVRNSTIFEGSGSGNSYILLVSQNNSAETGGALKAITVENTTGGDLLVYAGHGEIVLQNNVNLKEVTAWRIRLQQSAKVQYQSGLANTLFSAGPGGGYEIEDWEEVE